MAWVAMLDCAGSFNTNSPDCGMHSCLHTNQSARSFTSVASGSGFPATFTSVASNTWPSKPWLTMLATWIMRGVGQTVGPADKPLGSCQLSWVASPLSPGLSQ